MKTLTLEQVGTLKNVCWEKENETSFSFIPDVKTFTELTDFDVEKWTDDLQSTELSIKYQTTNITEYGIPYFALRFIAKIHGIIWADEYFVMFKGDELGLFTPKAEEQETMTLENLEAAINKFTPEEVAKLIEGNCTDVYDAIRDIVLDNLEVNDLPGWLQDDAGKDWVENNLDDAKEKYLENASCSDLKDLAVEIINDYL